MESDNRIRAEETLRRWLNEDMRSLILCNPVDPEGIAKVKIRPVMLQNQLHFQSEELKGTKVFHKNFTQEDCVIYAAGLLGSTLKQAELESSKGKVHILTSKKGTMTIKEKKSTSSGGGGATEPVKIGLHNRQKHYILEEGTPVPFLIDLGVMTQEGNIVRSKYDKFRQINRFLEFIEDILPRLNRSRENVIIDFGCGKSYLTFAMYYYLHELKGYPLRIIGLDLKQDVIDRCNHLSARYKYEHLQFYHGDIASYEGVDHVDMVVTLHACDTATDYALAKAVRWGAGIILSVPCCQHELNRSMDNELLKPVLQYGILKERMAALYTDGLRAEILENQGYRTQLLEFIDMEHTPKNILIRAVRQGEKKDNRKAIQQILDFLHTEQTLYNLLMEE